MLHWLVIALGVLFTLCALVYTYLVFASLLENTGYTLFSIAAAVCHGLSPVLFVFFGYRFLAGQAAAWGLLPVLLAAVALLALYAGVMALWCRLVLGDVPELWVMALLTLAQAAVTGGAIYLFLRF